MPQNKGVGLTSTFRMVILLLMVCPSPCPTSTGVVLFRWSTAPLILCELRPLCKIPISRFGPHEVDEFPGDAPAPVDGPREQIFDLRLPGGSTVGPRRHRRRRRVV